MVVMDPSGDVASQQRNLILVSTGLMLLIIVPVIAMTVLFAWKYRQSNAGAPYDPEWHHSTQLEMVIWAAPLAIIVALGAVTWISTHLLDPYRPLSRLSRLEPVPAGAKPLHVQVVALDWKWLFIYPDLGIATVNELAAPINTPIDFDITSSSVMNSLSIPALAGQIYAMPGMQTQLHAVINKTGEFQGLSANYSGEGFSGMHFKFYGMNQADFDHWTSSIKSGSGQLDHAAYLQLEQPSENEPVRHYASTTADLYAAVVNRCVEPGKMCASDMMRVDANGGMGLAGVRNVLALEYDKDGRRGGATAPTAKRFVQAVCQPGAAKASHPQSPIGPLAESVGAGAPVALR